LIVLPIFQNRSTHFFYDIELNNELFHLKYYWNARELSWYMDIQDQNENNILMNIKLVINYILLLQYRYINELPKGQLFIMDLEQNPIIGGITFDNLGKRYQLIFFTNEEINTGVINFGF